MAGSIVVWEFENDALRYQAYEPHVSDYIEQQHTVFTSGPGSVGHPTGSSQVQLGTVDYNLVHFSLDLSSNTQKSQSGKVRPVRRSVYSSTHPVANGIKWQWSGDRHGSWVDYDFEVAEILEDALRNGTPTVNLSTTFPTMQYKIDLQVMEQSKFTTGFVRSVRRMTNHPFKYKTVHGSVSRGSTFTFGTSHLGSTSASNPPGSSYVAFLPGNPFSSMTSSWSNPASLLLSGFGSGPSHSTHNPALPAASRAASFPGVIGVSASAPSTSGASVGAVVKRIHSHSSGGHRKRNRGDAVSVSNMTSSADNGTTAEEVIKNYVTRVTKPPDKEDCAICCDDLKTGSGYDSGDSKKVDIALQLKCKHMFHKSCLFALYENGPKDGSLQCPTCKKIYGVKSGNCPAGTMNYYLMEETLPGFSNCKTYRIEYHISPGIQGPEHPNPGLRYNTRGFPRIGYLPATEKGDKVLRLLVKAWERRLTFTIGTSVTTGEPNTVVWNEIHHKTEFGSNHSGHGFPDPNYLDNVLAELAVHGVNEDDD